MLRVGLTGGIGSGKTAVSDRFARLGVPVIDADRLSRELVAKGQPALAEIAALFGPTVLTEAGELDRAALGQRVFADPAARHRLEQILHPRIRDAMQARVAALDAPYVILVIPLLLETGQTDLVDRVLVVDTSPERQRERIRQRDGFSDARIAQILAAQTDRAARLRAADDIIRNDAGLADLDRAVAALHANYLELSARS
jgi:dephospho-CoA kinase